MHAAAARIDYGPQWTAYFEAIVDAEAAGEPPQRLREMLAAAPAGDATAAMFRAWIAGLWRLRRERWGEVPADLLADDFPSPGAPVGVPDSEQE
jgi:hypothetical protein